MTKLNKKIQRKNLPKQRILSCLTIREFSNMVKMHPNTIYKGIKEGYIQGFRIGTGKRSPFRILDSEVDRILSLSILH